MLRGNGSVGGDGGDGALLPQCPKFTQPVNVMVLS
jgi:hypothetical protein